MIKKQKLVVHSTEVGSWLSLINEAQTRQSTYLCEDVESYLVFLLMRFTSELDYISKAIGLEMMHLNGKPGAVVQEKLKSIGDTCLLYTGLFPEVANKRNVSKSYYVDLGKVAFNNLSNHAIEEMKEIFEALSYDFVSITGILQGMRNINGHEQSLSLQEAMTQDCANDNLIYCPAIPKGKIN